jgi:hypothetical protein
LADRDAIIHRMRPLLPLLICLVATGAAPPVLAWSADGHATVGAIANRLLTGTRAAREVQRILSRNETLQVAAVWADCVKGVAEKPPFAFTVDARFPECVPFQSRSQQRAMKAYVKRNLDACRPKTGEETCHRQYHYVNLAIQRDTYAVSLTGASDHDVVASIRACIAVLRGQRTPAPYQLKDKREALRLLAHLVGDIHQPLHVASVYLDTNGALVDPDATGFAPATFTRGGNQLRVGNQNLHGLWDSIPASLRAPQFPASLEEEVFDVVPHFADDIDAWPAHWAAESLRFGREAFDGVTFGAETNAGTPEQRWNATLPPDYALTRERIQRARLITAGARLAELLRSIWR